MTRSVLTFKNAICSLLPPMRSSSSGISEGLFQESLLLLNFTEMLNIVQSSERGRNLRWETETKREG